MNSILLPRALNPIIYPSNDKGLEMVLCRIRLAMADGYIVDLNDNEVVAVFQLAKDLGYTIDAVTMTISKESKEGG